MLEFNSNSDSESESVSELKVTGLIIIFILRPGVENIRAAVKRTLAANKDVYCYIFKPLVYIFN